MQVRQSAVVSFGSEEFSAAERLLRWSAAGAALGAVLLLLTTLSVLAPDRSAAGGLLLIAGWLLLAAGLLGVLMAVRSGREVRLGPGRTVVIHRPVLPPRRFVGVEQVVLNEQLWSLAVPVVGSQPGAAASSGPGPIAPEHGAASLSVALADGREIPLGEVEWPDRRAAADRAASILGAGVVVQRSSTVASCG